MTIIEYCWLPKSSRFGLFLNNKVTYNFIIRHVLNKVGWVLSLQLIVRDDEPNGLGWVEGYYYYYFYYFYYLLIDRPHTVGSFAWNFYFRFINISNMRWIMIDTITHLESRVYMCNDMTGANQFARVLLY